MYLPDKAGRRRATAVFLLPSLVGIIGFCILPIMGSLFSASWTMTCSGPWKA